MHEQVTDFCQDLDIILVLTKFPRVDKNLQTQDDHESAHEQNNC